MMPGKGNQGKIRMSTLTHLLFLLCLITIIIIISPRRSCIKDVTVLVVPVILALPSYNCPLYISVFGRPQVQDRQANSKFYTLEVRSDRHFSISYLKKKKDILVINGNEYTEIVTSKYLFTFFSFSFSSSHDWKGMD